MEGGIRTGGCARIAGAVAYITAFGVGDILYNVRKARKGVFEKVVIKKPRIIKSMRTSGIQVTLYVDTYNALWNESDLVAYDAALQLATIYYNNLVQEYNSLNSCGYSLTEL